MAYRESCAYANAIHGATTLNLGATFFTSAYSAEWVRHALLAVFITENKMDQFLAIPSQNAMSNQNV